MCHQEVAGRTGQAVGRFDPCGRTRLAQPSYLLPDLSGMSRLTTILAATAAAGLALAILGDTPTERWDSWVPLDATREIGAGLLTGAIVGAVLHSMAERAEQRRDDHDAQLSTEAKRHALAVAIATKDDLTGIVLARQDLRGIVLDGRDLTGADFRHADLAGANLSRAILNGADLAGANLNKAILASAHLVGADLSSADLIEADLGSANIESAKFHYANLTGANLDFVKAHRTEFHCSDLVGADLSSGEFVGANLYDADLYHAALDGADLATARPDLSRRMGEWRSCPALPDGFDPPQNGGRREWDSDLSGIYSMATDDRPADRPARYMPPTTGALAARLERVVDLSELDVPAEGISELRTPDPAPDYQRSVWTVGEGWQNHGPSRPIVGRPLGETE